MLEADRNWTMCAMMTWVGQPGNHSFWLQAFLPGWPNCVNNGFPFENRMPSQITLHGWRLSSKPWNPTSSFWMKQLAWLRIVHSGDCCLCLVLHTRCGACQKWMNVWISGCIFLYCWDATTIVNFLYSTCTWCSDPSLHMTQSKFPPQQFVLRWCDVSIIQIAVELLSTVWWHHTIY